MTFNGTVLQNSFAEVDFREDEETGRMPSPVFRPEVELPNRILREGINSPRIDSLSDGAKSSTEDYPWSMTTAVFVPRLRHLGLAGHCDLKMGVAEAQVF